MYDLGRDVPLRNFIDKAKEVDADLICLSTLMTTTMPGMKRVVEMLKEENLHGKIKVMIGGGPVSQAYCDKIDAHAYSNLVMPKVSFVKENISIEVKNIILLDAIRKANLAQANGRIWYKVIWLI